MSPAPAEPRHEILPPSRASSPPPAALEVPAPEALSPAGDRWNVQLELREEEIAKLYGQGLARGAVVWRHGMHEWRPLLITRELQALLRRTRILPEARSTIPSADLRASMSDWEDTPRYPASPGPLPAPPRLPAGLSEPPAAQASVAQTLAPTAMEVPPPAEKRRRFELATVGLLSGAAAWLASTLFTPAPEEPTPTQQVLAAAAAAPVADAPRPSTVVTEPKSPTLGSSIPTVSLADLPLLASKGGTSRGYSGARVTSRPTSNAGGEGEGASRSELVAALSQAARAANSCGERSGPVRVVVTFANSGVARGIRVSGPDLAKETRSCIISAASRSRISPFVGDPVTVSKTL